MNFSPLSQEQQTIISKILYLDSYHITGPVYNIHFLKNTFTESTTAFLMNFGNKVIAIDGTDHDLWDLLSESTDRRFFNAIVSAQDRNLLTYTHPADKRPLYVNLLDFFDELLQNHREQRQDSSSEEQSSTHTIDQDCSYDDLDFFCNDI